MRCRDCQTAAEIRRTHRGFARCPTRHGVVRRVCGTSHVEGVVHRRVGPRKWARSEAGDARSAGALQGTKEATRRGTGCGPGDRAPGFEPEGFSAADPPFAQALASRRNHSAGLTLGPGDSDEDLRPRPSLVTAVPDDPATSDALLDENLDSEAGRRRSHRARVPRSASSRGPAPARHGCSPVASRTGSRRPPPTPATSSSSPSPRKAATELNRIGLRPRWAYTGPGGCRHVSHGRPGPAAPALDRTPA